MEPAVVYIEDYPYVTNGPVYRRACRRCSGAGHYLFDGYSSKCYRCRGDRVERYAAMTEAEAHKDAEKRSKARAARLAKKQAEWEAAWEANRAEREAAEAAEKAREEAKAAELAKYRWLEGEVGQDVQFEGTITYQNSVDTQFGFTVLTIVEVDQYTVVKFFSTARWVMDAKEGDKVQVVAKIKNFETYDGKKQTMVARPKLAPVGTETDDNFNLA